MLVVACFMAVVVRTALCFVCCGKFALQQHLIFEILMFTFFKLKWILLTIICSSSDTKLVLMQFVILFCKFSVLCLLSV